MRLSRKGNFLVQSMALALLLLFFASQAPELSLVGSNLVESYGFAYTKDVLPIPEQPTSDIREFQIPTNNSGPNAIVSAPYDRLWFVEFRAGKLGEFFTQNDSFKEFSIPENSSVPASLAIDGLGNIWFSDQSGQGSIWMFSPKANHFRKFATLTKDSTPLFVLADKENDIWFTETTANRIGELIYPGYKMVEYTLPSPNSGPVELAWGRNESSLWITETYTGKIARFDVSSRDFVEYSPPPSLTLRYPVGIVTDNFGDVWVSEHGGSAVVELTPGNSTFKSYPTSIPNTQFPISAVATLAIDSQGRLWFVEHYANKVGRLDPATGEMEEFQIPSAEPAYSVLNALDSQGNFWFTEFGSNAIAEVPNNATSSLETVVELSQGGNATSGNTINAQVTVSNALDVPQSVTLSTTSSFTVTGLTSSQQISLNSSILNLPPGGDAVVNAEITPNASLPSGIYSIGIVATVANSSAVGIAFISVKGQFNILRWLVSNYQPILIGSVVVLAVIYAAISRGSKKPKSR